VKFKSINFTCKSCGAPLRFSPINNSLQCEFCSSKESIEKSTKAIEEYNFQEALQHLDTYQAKEINKEVKCSKCAASFSMTPYSISANCPYCNTPAITEFVKEITPQSLLPFQLSQKEAQLGFKKWLGTLWFAPSKLKDFMNGDAKLKGYYLPHWTYDSKTDTEYQGLRGDIYYVTVERTVIVNGREERRNVREARINWTPVSGHVSNFFDDITIGASKTISHTILDNLTPWYTDVLVPFNDKYLSGFDSEEYTIGLDNGFEFAKVKMDMVIRQKIRYDIGGDQQQIQQMHTRYSHTTYKNVLFPIWTAQFKWQGKVYNYAINGQTGKVTGERPYSWLKIMLLVLSILAILGGFLYLEEHPNILENLDGVNLHLNQRINY
jgi:DNA-directed RNA polymerase subunit RPC12/RpoP